MVHVRTFAKECNVTGFSGHFFGFEKIGKHIGFCLCMRPSVRASYGLETFMYGFLKK